MSAQRQDPFDVLADIHAPEPETRAVESAVAESRRAFEDSRGASEVHGHRPSAWWRFRLEPWFLPVGGALAAVLAVIVVLPMVGEPRQDRPVEVAMGEPVAISIPDSNIPMRMGAQQPQIPPPPLEEANRITVGDVELAYVLVSPTLALYLVDDAMLLSVDQLLGPMGGAIVLLDAFMFERGDGFAPGLALNWQQVFEGGEPEPVWMVYVPDEDRFRRDIELSDAVWNAPDRAAVLALLEQDR